MIIHRLIVGSIRIARGNGGGPRSEMSLRLIAESGSIDGASKFNYMDRFVVGRTRPMDRAR